MYSVVMSMQAPKIKQQHCRPKIHLKLGLNKHGATHRSNDSRYNHQMRPCVLVTPSISRTQIGETSRHNHLCLCKLSLLTLCNEKYWSINHWTFSVGCRWKSFRPKAGRFWRLVYTCSIFLQLMVANKSLRIKRSKLLASTELTPQILLKTAVGMPKVIPLPAFILLYTTASLFIAALTLRTQMRTADAKLYSNRGTSYVRKRACTGLSGACYDRPVRCEMHPNGLLHVNIITLFSESTTCLSLS